MDSGSPPPAPDYKGAAQATAAGNEQNLQQQIWADRPNQYTPWGSSTWTQSTDQTAYNRALSDWQAAGANPDSRPDQNAYTTWTQNLTLTPEEQQALNAQQQVQMNQSNLAQQMQGQVAQTMQNGFTAPQMSSYLGGLPGINTSFGGFYGGGTQPTIQTFNSAGQNVNTNAGGAVSGAGSVNLNAPQFSDATAQQGADAAYKASTALLQDQWNQQSKNLDTQLRLQGLTPGTEAYNNAAQNLSRTQAEQQDQLANQAIVTGNDMANQNYASALAGYNAGNEAQQQAYGQGLSTFNAGNQALGQQFSQDIGAMAADNQARQQAYEQALSTYGANTSAQQASNQAQEQAYEQAMQRYQTAYQTAYQNYLQPLNSMNAVMTGQQVGMPQMPWFASAGYAPGADYMGAAHAQGQWDSGLYAQDAANAASTNNTMISSAALAAAAYFA